MHGKKCVRRMLGKPVTRAILHIGIQWIKSREESKMMSTLKV